MFGIDMVALPQMIEDTYTTPATAFPSSKRGGCNPSGVPIMGKHRPQGKGLTHGCPAIAAPNAIGIDDWAWRRNQRYGTTFFSPGRPNRATTLEHEVGAIGA